MDQQKYRELILEACLALDPQRQGPNWPDPIQRDGRPLDEMARDLVVLLDVAADAAADRWDSQAEQYYRGISDRLVSEGGLTWTR